MFSATGIHCLKTKEGKRPFGIILAYLNGKPSALRAGSDFSIPIESSKVKHRKTLKIVVILVIIVITNNNDNK